MVETIHVPERTGGEQVVLARAIDRAVHGLNLDSLSQGRIRLEVVALAPDAAGFVESALRLRLLEQGWLVTEDPARTPPDQILHVVMSEIGPETRTKVLQIPLPLPIPTTAAVPIGLTLWQKQVEKAEVRLRAYLVDATNGELLSVIEATGAQASTSEVRTLGVIGPVRKVDPSPQDTQHRSPIDE